MARLNIPSTLGKLEQLTRTVEQDNLLPHNAADKKPGTIQFAGGKNPIKHVIYVIKENRTYDQILGDLKVGDGDPSLTMYGADITPNEHKLALQFGVLDNFYDSGEVSGDGHLWSTAAITSDYNEKTWQIAYRGKERTYDFQGTVAGEYPLDHNEADIDDPSTGFLWDNLARHGVSYRDYGEYVNAAWCNKVPKAASPKQGTPSTQEAACARTDVQQGEALASNVGDPHGGSSPWPWSVPLFKGVKATKAVLRDHYDPLYPDFNTDYPDQLRADEFLNDSPLMRVLAWRTKVPSLNCRHLSCSIFLMITQEALVPNGRAQQLPWQTTIWQWGAWSRPCRIALTGMTLQYLFWKMTRRTGRPY